MAKQLDKATGQQQKKRGRPQKLQPDEQTLKTLSGLARIQCTTKEAAAVLEVSEQTFFAFLERYKNARETWDNGKEYGKSSLKRNQFRMSETNPAMAIWLGKQYLGQSDKITDVTPIRSTEAVDNRIRSLIAGGKEDRTSGTSGRESASGAEGETVPTVSGHGTA